MVVTVAVTGADVFRENNPNIPYTTEEIAESSIEAAQAGATVVHLHVREDDGTPSGRPELFQDVITRVRAGSELITMVSTGGANDMTIEERTTGLEARPDLSGVESGSMNFGDETFITPPPAARGIIERATQAGIGLEVEAFDVGHVATAVRWLEDGLIQEPMRINLVFGVPGGIDASPEALVAMLRPAASRDVLDRDVCRTPSPEDARARASARCPLHQDGTRGRRIHQPRSSGSVQRRAGECGHRSGARPRAGNRDPGPDARTARARGLRMSSLIEALGTARVLEPPGALPQAALRLDTTLPLQPYEIELDADTLCIDSTSFRQLAESNGSDPAKMRDAILGIVAQRGKMHNPVTGSGGILTGIVRAVGETYPDPPPVGTRIVSLASLTLTPLRLDTAGPLDPDNPHVPVTGTAYLPSAVPWIEYPDQLSLEAALAALDVCNAAFQTRSLIDGATHTVLVLGGGHAGLLALAAARDSLPDGARAVLIDAEERICQRARDLELCELAVRLDLRDAVAAFASSSRPGCRGPI